MQLVLQELRNRDSPEDRQFENVAAWNPDGDAPVPAEMLVIYPDEMWHEREPEELIARINGPYTILSAQPDDADIETVETDLTREDVLGEPRAMSQPDSTDN